MKKISNILGLWLLMLAMVTVVACEGSDAPYNGYVETTQDNAATLVLKENCSMSPETFLMSLWTALRISAVGASSAETSSLLSMTFWYNPQNFLRKR